jgi:enterochelin esterase-like enzyme
VAAWAQGDVLHVLWRGHAEQVQLGGGVQPRLWPVAGADDLWEASLRIRRLDEAVISVVVAPHAPGQQGPVRMTGRLIWRGPRAPAARPAAERLRGAIEEHSLDSAALCAARRVTVYRPPGRAVAGCVLADGEAAHGFARVLEPAIDDGSVPPVLLVGVHTGTDPGGLRPGRPDRRAQEYLPGHHRQRFAAHLRFVADEVVPWAARRFGPVPGTWAAAGFSNGAAWAIAAAQRRPEVFGAVAALSAGVVPKRISGQSRSVPVRHYLAAGTLEPGFRRATRDWAERLRRAGLPCRHEEWIGGHDHLWWEQQFPAALAWLDLKLPGPADKTRAMSCAAI